MSSLQPVVQQQQQQPPPMAMTQQASHSGGGSIGPVIAVLAVILVLGVIAGVIGRLCAGGRVLGFGHFDFEGWMERKCGSCIDGRLEAPPPPPPPPLAPAALSPSADGAGRRAIPIVIPVEVAPEGGNQHATAHTARRAT